MYMFVYKNIKNFSFKIQNFMCFFSFQLTNFTSRWDCIKKLTLNGVKDIAKHRVNVKDIDRNNKMVEN